MQRSLRILSLSYFPLFFPTLPYKSLLLIPFAKSNLSLSSQIKSRFPLSISIVYRSLIDMAEVLRPEMLDISNDTSSLASPELLHVLAVDDSIVDRKFIERLLRVSSCKGKKEKFLFILRNLFDVRNLTVCF